jgi:hypothetical protein
MSTNDPDAKLLETYEQECRDVAGLKLSEVNIRLQKQVAERAAKYKPRNPLDELRRLREQARLAMPEIMEFNDQALEHIERLIDENERLEGELEEARGIWRSVGKLPEPNVDVLVIRQIGNKCVAYIGSDDNWWTNEGTEQIGTPTHWMPLPEAPDVRR